MKQAKGEVTFVEAVLEFVLLVRRVDVDEDEVGHGCGELRETPFVVVRRIDANSISLFESELEQTCGELLTLLVVLLVRHDLVLFVRDERGVVRELFRCFAELLRDCFVFEFR